MKKVYLQPKIVIDDNPQKDILTESVGVDWNDDWGSDWDPYQEN